MRVLERIASESSHREAVLEVLRRERPGQVSAPVTRDLLWLIGTLQERPMLERRATEAALAAERHVAEEAHTAEQIRATHSWLSRQTHVPGAAHLTPSDAENLIGYVDNVDRVRQSVDLLPLSADARRNAATTWLRRRLRSDLEKRSSVCWSCKAAVYADLNPDCPRCHWMVCWCDACRDPRHKKGACVRMDPRRALPGELMHDVDVDPFPGPN